MPVTEAGHKIHNHKDQKNTKYTEKQLVTESSGDGNSNECNTKKLKG